MFRNVLSLLEKSETRKKTFKIWISYVYTYSNRDFYLAGQFSAYLFWIINKMTMKFGFLIVDEIFLDADTVAPFIGRTWIEIAYLLWVEMINKLMLQYIIFRLGAFQL